MPQRNTIEVKLPLKQPDRCFDCPLLGLLPKEMRQPRGQMTHVCIPLLKAISPRFARVRGSQRDNRHPLHKPCEQHWGMWLMQPGGLFRMSKELYIKFRLPYEQTQQIIIDFNWNKKQKYGID